MNIKQSKMKVKGFFEHFCECFGLLAAYCMVFYFLWEGMLGFVGAK